MTKNIRLVFLCPTYSLRTVQAGLCVCAKFADDEWLVKGDVPHSGIGILGPLFIPSDVLVGANHIESIAQRVVNVFIVALGAN